MIQPIRHTASSDYTYNGLPIHCARGVHEEVSKLIVRVSQTLSAEEQKNMIVYELGAGSGALTERLTDAGLNVRPYDLEASTWRSKQTEINVHDLNSDQLPVEIISYQGPKFIVAVEVIEHLKSPSEFYQKLSSVMKANDYLIITTPNIFSSTSMVKALTRAELFSFSLESRYKSGHISPLPEFLMTAFAEDNHLSVVYKLNIGSASCNALTGIMIRISSAMLNFLRRRSLGRGHELVTLHLLTKHQR
jgi:2-polyprenyl-3-methyl-5-hydroxy-6-metoxy-1,4-benzoquinol methylase